MRSITEILNHLFNLTWSCSDVHFLPSWMGMVKSLAQQIWTVSRETNHFKLYFSLSLALFLVHINNPYELHTCIFLLHYCTTSYVYIQPYILSPFLSVKYHSGNLCLNEEAGGKRCPPQCVLLFCF